MKIKQLQRHTQKEETRQEGPRQEAAEDRIRTWLITVAMVIGPLVLLGLYYKTTFAGLTNPDALDFAQLGRNLSQGHGFVTYILRPLALGPHTTANALRQPDVTHGPLYPFILALAFGVLGAKDAVVAGVSAIFYLLTIPLVFWLGSRMFSRTVGILSALVFMVNVLMLEYACSGLPITLEIFLMTALVAVLYGLAAHKERQPQTNKEALPEQPQAAAPKGLLVLAGVVTALLYLTDPIFIWIFPVSFGFVFWLYTERRLPSTGLFLSGFFVLSIWTMGRNYLLTGNPVFGLRGMDIWAFTKLYPGDLIYRIAPDDVVQGKEIFLSLAMKILSGLGQVVAQLPQISGSWVLAFFLPSLFFRFADSAVNAARGVALLCLGGIVIGLLLFGIQLPLTTAVLPVLFIFAMAYLLYLGQQARLTRGGAITTVCLLTVAMIYPIANNMFFSDEHPMPLKQSGPAKSLIKMTSVDDVVLSDQPWIVAWYADRPSMWIPSSDVQVYDMAQKFNARWLFLTDSAQDLSPEWEVIQGHFQQWNQEYQQSVNLRKQAATIAANPQSSPTLRQQAISVERRPLPSPEGIVNRPGAQVVPILQALNGFTAVPPEQNADLSTVIAVRQSTSAYGASAAPKPHS